MNILRPDDFIEENIDKARELLRENIPISEYLTNEGFTINTYNGKIRCPNPNHDDSSASCFFDDSTGQINCFGCDLKGTVVELNMIIQKGEDENYSQVRSIRDLSKKYKVRIPDLQKRDMRITRVKRKARDKKVEIRQEKVYYARLQELERAIFQSYYAKNITLEELMNCLKIVDDVWLQNTAPKEGYKKLRGYISGNSSKVCK